MTSASTVQTSTATEIWPRLEQRKLIQWALAWAFDIASPPSR
jgi:hypothetical protein